MISIFAKEIDRTWFGLAYTGQSIVATATDSTKDRTMKDLLRSIPPNVEWQIIEKGSDFAEKTILLLKELHEGNEEHKNFSIATEFFSEPIVSVLKVAAAIPVGYVTSYGNIAKAADIGPRMVGQIMASNPLYPIVPCHRVVGADFSLVGYGGRKGPQALRAKLARLNKEKKGFKNKKEILVNGKSLIVYPMEQVFTKVTRNRLDFPSQQKLSNKTRTENIQ